MFTITVFGTPTVRGPDRRLTVADLPRGKPLQLLEIIVLARGAVVSKSTVIDYLWGHQPPAHAVATLETYVSVLRRSLQPGVAGRATIVRTARGGYRLDRDRVRLDLDDFDETVTRAKRAAPHDALPLWQHAVDLSRSDVLDHDPDAEWAHDIRMDYARRGVRAAICGARAALDIGCPELAIPLAEVAVARDSLAEDGWQALIEAYGCIGRPAEAARAAATCLETLARELGVYPSPLTRRLLRAALAPHAAPSTRPLAVAVGR